MSEVKATVAGDQLDLLFDINREIIRKKGKHVQFCEQFLNPNVEKHMKNEHTLLSIAIINRNTEMVQLLLKRQNSSIETLTTNNDSILHLLGRFWEDNYKEIVSSLLSNSELLMRTNKHNQTCLHNGCVDFLNFVLDGNYITKELLNLQDNFGRPFIFHLVCSKNELPILKLCIEKGADITIKDNQGFTILEHAKLYGAKEILDYLNPLFNTQTIDNTNLKRYDHVQCISSNITGVIISVVMPQNDCVTVAFNQPGLCQNILKSNLKKLPKALTLTQGSFIDDYDLLSEGLLVTDINQNRLIVESKHDTCCTISKLEDRQEKITYNKDTVKTSSFCHYIKLIRVF
jgi:hypothetical protein